MVSSVDLISASPQTEQVQNKSEKTSPQKTGQDFHSIFTVQRNKQSAQEPENESLSETIVHPDQSSQSPDESPEIENEVLTELAVVPQDTHETKIASLDNTAQEWTLEDFFQAQIEPESPYASIAVTDLHNIVENEQQTQAMSPEFLSESETALVEVETDIQSPPFIASRANETEESVHTDQDLSQNPLPTATPPINPSTTIAKEENTSHPSQDEQVTANLSVTQLKSLSLNHESKNQNASITVTQTPGTYPNGELSGQTAPTISNQVLNSELSENTLFQRLHNTESHQSLQTMLQQNPHLEPIDTLATNQNQSPLLTYSSQAEQIDHRFQAEMASGRTQNNASEQLIERFQVSRQITQQLQILKQGKQKSLQMTLEPASLGKLSLHLRQDQQHIHLQILTESSLTKDLIESQLQHLKQQFNQQGLDLHQVSVDVHPDWSESQQESGSEQTQNKQSTSNFQLTVNPTDTEMDESNSLEASDNTSNPQINYLA